jgi:undecaprenyl-diphosphatase
MFFAGSVSSAVVGYLTIRVLLRLLASHSLRVFAYYRFALAAVVDVVFLSSGS